MIRLCNVMAYSTDISPPTRRESSTARCSSGYAWCGVYECVREKQRETERGMPGVGCVQYGGVREVALARARSPSRVARRGRGEGAREEGKIVRGREERVSL